MLLVQSNLFSAAGDFFFFRARGNLLGGLINWKLDSPDLTKGPPGELWDPIKWFSQGDVVAAGCRGQEQTGEDRPMDRSLQLCGPLPESLQLSAHLWDKVSMVRAHPSFIKCLESVQWRIWGVRLSQYGSGGAMSLEWEKVQWHKEKMGAPTYRELMRFSAFREWVSQRSVRASSSALSCSQVSLLGAPIKPVDKAKKDNSYHFRGLGGAG